MILYLHCGYPKAASTYLQNYTFKKINEINLIDPLRQGLFDEIKEKLISVNEEEFLKNVDEFTKMLEDILVLDYKKKNIISDEALTSIQYNYLSIVKSTQLFQRFEKILLKHNQITEVKYLLIERDPFKLLFSYYTMDNLFLKSFGINTHKQFIEFLIKKDLLKLFHSSYIKKITNQKVNIIDFKLLNENRELFYKNLEEYFDLNFDIGDLINDSNPINFNMKDSNKVYNDTKLLNKFLYKIRNNLFYDKFLRKLFKRKIKEKVKMFLNIIFPSKKIFYDDSTEKLIEQNIKKND